MTLQSAQPAPLWKRVVAGLIDFTFMWVILWMPIMLLFFGDIDNEIDFTRSGIGAYFLYIRLLALSLFPFCLRDAFAGRGLGKWLIGLRVVDAADLTTAATLQQGIIRNLTIWFSPMGLASAHAHPDKMRFGDRLAGTAVVEVAPDPTSSILARRLFKGIAFVAAAMCCILSVVLGFSKYVRNSEVHEAAVTFIVGHEPLQEVVELTPDNIKLMVARYRPSSDGAWAHLVYTRKTNDFNAQLEVLLKRGIEERSPWKVEDASGVVTFTGGKDEKQRTFAFLLTKDFHRFLTDDEVKKIFKEMRSPAQVIPELKAADNETVNPAAP